MYKYIKILICKILYISTCLILCFYIYIILFSPNSYDLLSKKVVKNIVNIIIKNLIRYVMTALKINQSNSMSL